MPARWHRALAAVIAAGAASFLGTPSAPAVVGGTAATIQSAPWTVFVRTEFDAYEEDCTGSVIDATHIVTAGHCLYDDNGTLARADAVSIEAGVSNAFSPGSGDLEQSPPVASVRVHPGYAYKPDTVAADDVAVLGLAAPLDLSGPAVKAVALPAAGASFPALASVSIAGYGLEDGKAAEASGALQSMTARVFWQGQCSSASYSIIELTNGIELCESSQASSVCSGDSGAGLVTSDGAPTLVGVVTGSAADCPAGSDGVAVFVGAPEILSFIQGSDAPPVAPRASAATVSDLTWTHPLVEGGELTCSTDGWSGPVQLAYSFLDGATGAVLKTGSSPTYRLPPGTSGTTIFCEVAAANAGGTTVAYTAATPTIAAAPRITIAKHAPLAGTAGRAITVRVVVDVPPGLVGTLDVCATPPASVGKRTCATSHTLSGRVPVTLVVRIRPHARPGLTRLAIAASAGPSHARTVVRLRVRPAG